MTVNVKKTIITEETKIIKVIRAGGGKASEILFLHDFFSWKKEKERHINCSHSKMLCTQTSGENACEMR